MQKQPASSNGKPAANSGAVGARGDVAHPATEKMTVPKPGPKPTAKVQGKPVPKPGPKAAPKPGKPVEAVMHVVKDGPGEASKPAAGVKPAVKPAVSVKPGAGVATAQAMGDGAGSREGRTAGGPMTPVAKPSPAMMKPHRVQSAVKAAADKERGVGSPSTTGPAPAAPRFAAGKQQGATSVPKPGKPVAPNETVTSAAVSQTAAVLQTAAGAAEPEPAAEASSVRPDSGDSTVPSAETVPGVKDAPAARESGEALPVADRAATTSVLEEPSVPGQNGPSATPVDTASAADELPEAPLVPEADETVASAIPGEPVPDVLNLSAKGAVNVQEPVLDLPEVEPASASEAESPVEPPSPVETAARAASLEAAEPAVAETPAVDDVPAGVQAVSLAEQRPNGRTSGVALTALMAVSFVLEVALLGAGALWALGALPLAPVLAVLVTVIPLMVFWGLFMSPKARFRVSPVPHALLSHVLFAAGATLLALAGQPALAIAMGALTVASIVLTLLVRGQDSVGNAGESVKRRRKSKGSGRRAAR